MTQGLLALLKAVTYASTLSGLGMSAAPLSRRRLRVVVGQHLEWQRLAHAGQRIPVPVFLDLLRVRRNAGHPVAAGARGARPSARGGGGGSSGRRGRALREPLAALSSIYRRGIRVHY